MQPMTTEEAIERFSTLLREKEEELSLVKSESRDSMLLDSLWAELAFKSEEIVGLWVQDQLHAKAARGEENIREN